MNEVNKTLYIPLYGKAKVSREHIILNDPMAERIWAKESFVLKRQSRSKWLTYNMAMRARIFDDWTNQMLEKHKNAYVLHIGCGLDSRYLRVNQNYFKWIDCDLPEVIDVRHKYYQESSSYIMMAMDATDVKQMNQLPENDYAIVILEGISMYLSHEELHQLLKVLQSKYSYLFVLMDIYTQFGAKASRYKNPINDVGVSKIYGINQIEDIIGDLDYRFVSEHTLTPDYLIKELKKHDRMIFKLLFKNRLYRKIYRLIELTSK